MNNALKMWEDGPHHALGEPSCWMMHAMVRVVMCMQPSHAHQPLRPSY